LRTWIRDGLITDLRLTQLETHIPAYTSACHVGLLINLNAFLGDPQSL
jgi:hypothetical protein